MPVTTKEPAATFACPACGKTFAWNPAKAGKKGPCKCGQILTVPRERPGAEDDPGDSGDYELADHLANQDEIPAVAKARQCGGCGAQLDPTAVVCVRCGLDFRTGKKVGAGKPAAKASAAAAGGSDPRFAGIVVPSKPPKIDEGNAKPLLYGLGGVVVAAILAIGLVKGVGVLGGGDPMEGRHAEDVEAMEKLADAGPTEARQWLETGTTDRMLGGMSERQAMAQIDRWYADGCKTVWAFGSRMSISAVLELPDDPAKREKLFAWRDKYYALSPEEALPDEGQQYMVVYVKL